MLRPDVTIERLHARQAGCLPGTFALRVTALAENRLDAEITIEPWMLAPNGFLHAASVLLLADTSAGYACMAHLPEGAKNFTTIELKSNFLGTARAGVLRAEATADHLGRSTHVWSATVFGPDARRVALFRCTQMILWVKPARRAGATAGAAALGDAEIDELAAGLDALPPPYAPLDVSMVDGFICGVLVQPGAIPLARWLPFVLDEEGRTLPAVPALARLRELLERRAGEIRGAIQRRAWFDPWVFVPDDAPAADADAIAATVAPWVAGLAGALSVFPALLQAEGPELDDALAPAFRWLDPAELEDAAGLFEAIAELAPADSVEAAVEGLVRSTLLLADVAGLPEAAAPR